MRSQLRWFGVTLLLCLMVVPMAQANKVHQKQTDKVKQKLEKGPVRFDQPDEAARFYLMKRSPDGKNLPVEKYLQALEYMKDMPRYSTALKQELPPMSRSSRNPDSPEIGTWTPLGPGNIGGRTRALLIVPSSPSTMYAGGVAGGVWKTTNGGTTWTPISDLIANIAISTMAMDPANSSIIYAGTGEGFFNVDAVRGAGIFKTTDAGATWTHLSATNNSNFHYVNKIVISPNNSNRVYAATRTGIYRSTDAGNNWSLVHNPGVQGGCTDMVIRTDQSTDTIFAACGTGQQATIYRNTDAGGSGTWTSVLTESCMGRTSLALAPSNQNVIYALSASICSGDYNGGLHAVFRSTTGGGSGSWSARVRNTDANKLNTVLLTNPIIAFLTECNQGTSQFFNQGWYDNVIAVDPLNSDIVWAGGIDLFRSDDGGANWGMASHWWANTSNPRYTHADQHLIVFHPQYNGGTNKIMFVGNDGGIFRTNDARAATATGASAPCSTSNGSVNWTELNNNYGVTQFYHGVPYPGGTTYFGGCQDNGTIRGTDAGGSEGWNSVFGGDGGYVAVDPNNTNIIYFETTKLSIRKSTDGGTTSSPATTGITGDNGFQFIAPFVMDPSNSQRLWTGGWYIWRTTNGAGNWVRASDLTSGEGNVSAIGIAPSDGNYVLVGMSDGWIHYTTTGLSNDSSTTWLSTQPRTGYVSWLTYDPTNKNIAYATYATFGGSHVWKSTNAGGAWTSIDGNLPDIPVHSIVVDPNNTSTLYIGTDVGVFVTTNGGTSWAVENTGFANVVTEALALNGTKLFAFTHGRGAWRVDTAVSCTYTISPTSQSFPASGGTGSINVATQAGCAWNAVSNNSWITITSGSSGTGNGTVNYTVASNTGGARTGTITVAGQTFTVNQSAASGGPANDNCASATIVSSTPYTDNTNTSSATTEASDPTPSCGLGSRNKSVWYRFTASSNGTVTADTFGSSYDTVLSVYTGSCGAFTEVTCNDDSGGVQSSVTFNASSGTTYYFMVSDYGSSGGSLTFHLNISATCTYTISPTSQSFPASGGTGSINVTTQAGCAWNAVSNNSWITITSGSSGTGNGTVNYTVASNTGGARTGTITVAGQTFTVNQAAASCTYTISPTSQSFPASGGTGSINVTTQSGCAWNAVSNNSWTTITSGSSGTGNGTVNYTVASNTGGARTGTITVAGQTFTVNQAAAGGSYIFFDDFEDGSASDWTVIKGNWSVVSGSLSGTTDKKGDILAPSPSFTDATIEADMQINTALGRVSVLGWYLNKRDYVEIRLMDDKDKLLLKQKYGDGTVAAKGSIPVNVIPGVNYRLKVVYTPGVFDVYLDNTYLMSVFTYVTPIGTVGLRVKSITGLPTNGTFREIAVY